jgi:Cu/Zn superoxide dismutase
MRHLLTAGALALMVVGCYGQAMPCASGKTVDFTLLDSNGSALVVHQGADDYLTDPAGAAGERIACGVVADFEV